MVQKLQYVIMYLQISWLRCCRLSGRCWLELNCNEAHGRYHVFILNLRRVVATANMLWCVPQHWYVAPSPTIELEASTIYLGGHYSICGVITWRAEKLVLPDVNKYKLRRKNGIASYWRLRYFLFIWAIRKHCAWLVIFKIEV